MKILNATLSMDAIVRHTEVNVSLIGQRGIEASAEQPASFSLKLPSSEKENIASEINQENSVKADVNETSDDGLSSPQNSNLHTFTESLLGRPVRLTGAESMRDSARSFFTGPRRWSSQFIMNSRAVEVKKTFNSMRFESEGIIQTEDGRSIDFSFDVSVEHTELEYSNLWSSTSRFLDPLVLSFDSGLETLGNTKFAFDLDLDGTSEMISGLAAGSGFLSIDLNQDGQINDGRELFGPTSGMGFAELSRFDEDQNLWIDENDPVFDQLHVWMAAGSENERLVTLREAGVGALSLSSLETSFDMKNNTGDVLGQIGRASIFIMESGAVRSLQEIDLALDVNDTVKIRQNQQVETIRQAVAIMRQMVERNASRTSNWQRRSLMGLEEKKTSLYEQYWDWYHKSDVENV